MATKGSIAKRELESLNSVQSRVARIAELLETSILFGSVKAASPDLEKVAILETVDAVLTDIENHLVDLKNEPQPAAKQVKDKPSVRNRRGD